MPRPKTRNTGGIYQRPNSPNWWATYPNGRGGSTRKSTGVPVAEDPDGLKAQAVRATWRAQRQTQETGKGASFDDLMLAYLGQVTPTKRAPERDRYSAKALYKAFTGRALESIKAADVRGYIARRTAVGVAAGTINKEIGLMSAALNWARRELEWDALNPWGSRRLKEPPGRARWLTQAEAESLLDAAVQRQALAPWLDSFIRIGLYAGLRPGEILGLTWARVDLTGNRIAFEPGDQKNGRRAVVPINQEARRAFLDRARWRATHCPGSIWVFARKDGSRIASVKRAFAGAVAAAGLADVHPHDLRRTFGSWLVQAGVGIERVSELLRHHDVAITARVYAHLRPKDLADAAAILDGLRGGDAHRLAHDKEEKREGNEKPAVTG